MKVILVILLLMATAMSQTSLPEKPTSQHKFFDKGNIVRFSFLAGAMTLDAYSTQRFLSPEIQAKYNRPGVTKPYEINPLARPLVEHEALGQFAASGLSYSLVLGSSAILHKTNHHKWERALPLIVGGISLAVGGINLRF